MLYFSDRKPADNPTDLTYSQHSSMCSGGRVVIDNLAELRDNLKPKLPKSNSMRMCIRNVMEGRVQGNFYTDAWPHFTTVVFQCVEPRLSDTADLLCYSTSKHDLLHVLQQNQLVTEGKWQMIQIIEDDNKTIGEYLMKNLKIDGQVLLPQDYSVVQSGMYGLVKKIELPSLPCPEGYFLGPLTEKHNELTTSQGQWFNKVGRPSSIVQEYHKQCIQRLDTVAIYHNENPTTPVAWGIHWAHNSTFGNAFTVEAHRRKGLSLAIAIETCRRMLARGDIPQCHILDYNSNSINLACKLGLTPIGRVTSIALHWNSCPFILSCLTEDT